MKITFIGTGAAIDSQSTASILVEDKANILLDCGYGAIYSFWKHNDSPEFLDAIYLSHGHGDHILGVPALLIKMQHAKRKKPLYIITQPYVYKNILSIFKMVFPKNYEDFKSNIRFIEASKTSFKGMKLEFAKTQHALPNLAIKITSGKTFSYSGDGMFTKTTEKLYKGSDLVVQEAYKLKEKTEGHATIQDAIDLSSRLKTKVGLIHVFPGQENDFTKNRNKASVFLCKPMQKIVL